MKLTGCILLLCACGGLSLAAVHGLRERVVQLRALLGALEEMERELSLRLTPLPELLARLGERTKGPAGEFFSLCAAGMGSLGERSFFQLWGQALEAADLRLEEEDRAALLDLGSTLGRYDSRSQRAAIGQARARLEEGLAEAAERRERMSRVYGALGLSAAAFMMILLV